jgi:predicted ATP-dependent protease
MGTPWLYYLLQTYDEDFHKLFKVKGEFAHEMSDNEDNRMSYAYLISNQCLREGLMPFGRDAVAKVMEHGLRLAEHQKKLSTQFLEITDLVREAHHYATEENLSLVSARHIRKAIDERIHRSDYIEHILGEMIEEGSILIDVQGSVAGQVNGLSVYDMGDYAFGKPSRVTARVFLGKEGVTNIERESDLGGRIHNKGVLILQGFFGSRYAQKTPLSFGATLCFEQSYGGVEGDSASSTELFALISAIAGVPLRQDLAVTGSVNQMGHIQAIGGVNLKIEGFYKTCKMKGLTGTQGVVIPESNVKNLMLDDEVVEAVEKGMFHIYPIETVDEGLELLTGMRAGEPDSYGDYAPGTLNHRVVGRLERFANQWKKLHAEA